MSTKNRLVQDDKKGLKQRGARPLPPNQQVELPTPMTQQTASTFGHLTTNHLKQLQRTIGNRAVGNLLNQRNKIQRYTEITTAGSKFDLLADDGKLAVSDHSRDAWAESNNIKKSNAILDGKHSKARIEELSSGGAKVKPPGRSGAKEIELKKFRMVDRVTGGEAELVDDCGTANQQMLGSETAGEEKFVATNKRGTTQEYTGSSEYHGDDNAPGGIVSTTEKLSGEIYTRIFEREFKKTLGRGDAVKEWDKLSALEKDRLSKKYGINKYAVPEVGQGITIGSERDMPGGDVNKAGTRTGYNFHFGLALLSSGYDYITLEDYDSSGVKYYFDMYGPASKKQSWAEADSNTDALGTKTTTMVVDHLESLTGETNEKDVPFVEDPAVYNKSGKRIGQLAQGTKIKIIQKGINWMKVEVSSGSHSGESGWILNKYFVND